MAARGSRGVMPVCIGGSEMTPGRDDRAAARRIALMYVPLSLGAAFLFWLAASLAGDYPAVGRSGFGFSA